MSKLVAGPNIFICDSCVMLCTEIIDELRTDDAQVTEAIPETETQMTAEDLRRELKQYRSSTRFFVRKAPVVSRKM